jgi:hypothetical protein
MGLWQRIRDAVTGREEPSLADDDEPRVTAVPYPTVDLVERSGEESVDEQREGEGFR